MPRPKLNVQTEPKRYYTISGATVIIYARERLGLSISNGLLQIWRNKGVGPSFIRPSATITLYDEDEVMEWLTEYARLRPRKVTRAA